MANNKPPVAGRYIDPFVDFSFKKIFGSEPNKDLLISFLNAVLKGRRVIIDLTYNKNEHPGSSKNQGAAVFDLLCTGSNGEQFIIEVQRAKQGRFKERSVFYTSRLISDLAPSGNRDEWNYNIPEVYFIALLEDFVLEGNPADEYLHDICLCNRDTGEIFYDKLGYTYIELRNFVKAGEELESDLDSWLFALKNLSRLNKIPLFLRKPIFVKLFNIAEYSNLTKEEKDMYDSSLKQKWDNQNIMDSAREESKLEGRLEGRLEGIVEGEIKMATNIALDMIKDGIPVAQISKFTKLSLEEIQKLKRNLN